MKQKTKLQNCITKVIEVKRPYHLKPEQNRYVDKNVRERMKLQIPNKPHPLPDFLNPAQIYYLKQKADKKDLTTGLLVDFLIQTGLRISEANRLMIQDIDFDNNQIKVIKGKGSKDRYVPITNNLLSKIRLYINKRNKGYLFVKRNNTKFSIRAMQKRIKGVLMECNFDKKLSTHSLRHTFACLCLAKGLRIEDIKLLMGHSSVKTTEIYAKLELGDVKQKYLQMMGGS